MPDEIVPGAPDDMSGGSGSADKIEGVQEPIEKTLHYKKKKHGEILARLMRLRDLGEESVSEMHDTWNRIDQHAGMFVDVTRSAIKGDGTIKTTEKEIPFERAFVVPVYFAVERVILTQLLSIFQARDPQFQYDGQGPEDVAGAKLIEAVVGNDLQRNRINSVFYQAFQNGLRYGVSPVHTFWYEDFGWTMKPLVSGPMAPLIGAQFPELLKPIRQWGLRQAYVKHVPVDPYKLRVDPRKSLMDFQDGDFVGHCRVESLMYFRERELAKEDGPYFNVDWLEKVGFDKSHRKGRDGSVGRSKGESGSGEQDVHTYEVEHLEVKIIPKDWGLGDSDRPEIWWFEWAGDAVIVRAHPSAYDHGMYSFNIGASFPDRNVVLAPGLGQLVEPLQRFVNWMGSSHLENIRRFINNASIVMERFIEVEDVVNPSPAGHIRATQEAQDLISQGMVSDPRVFYPQLGLQDVTQGHLQEITQMFDWVSRMTGANDPAQGMHLPSKRTATEIEQLSAASSQRTASMAEQFDSMLIQGMAEQHCMIRQEMTTDEQWYRVEGDLARQVEAQVGPGDMVQPMDGGGIRVKIAPPDLYGMYDYIPYTGVDPNNPARAVESLMQMLQVGGSLPIVSDPMMAAQMGEEEILDQKEVFIRIFENMKVKDVRRLFKPNPAIQVMEDQAVMDQVAAGNMVPAGEAM